MKRAVIRDCDRRPSAHLRDRRGERGVTIVLVAGAMVAIMAMAALSIDVVTLYLANADAQRSADAAALAAAKVISLSGLTGDPNNSAGYWSLVCGGGTSPATLAAQSVGIQNTVGGVSGTVNVSYSAGATATASADCSALPPAFGVNPVVTVSVNRANLPTFFSRIWGKKNASISATATAEAYNPSNSASVAGTMVPVQPRCVKPWIIPNKDPENGSTFVNPADGSISTQGIELNWTHPGVVGEEIFLNSACTGTTCTNVQASGLLAGQYMPAYVQANSVAVSAGPGCTVSDQYQQAIAGCDQSTVDAYPCGGNGATALADLSLNRGAETAAATQCLINAPGQDSIQTASYPFTIEAGSNNPLTAGAIKAGYVISTSNSIVTIPIMDGTTVPTGSVTPGVTIVGFLQAFVERVNDVGGIQNPVITVLNVSGCSNSATQTGVTGSSPVPVRLINYP
jgi:Flp pilus assembly protein TadG